VVLLVSALDCTEELHRPPEVCCVASKIATDKLRNELWLLLTDLSESLDSLHLNHQHNYTVVLGGGMMCGG